MGIEENKEVVRIFTERFGRGDNSVFDEMVTSNFVIHYLMNQGIDNDVNTLKQTNDGGHTAFPDYSIDIMDMIAEDDKVLVIAKRTGTNTGEFSGLPPTGKTVTMHRMAFYRLKNGKIAEGWNLDDYLGQLLQLGFTLTPPSQENATKGDINNGYRRE